MNISQFTQDTENHSNWYNCASDLNAAARILYAGKSTQKNLRDKLEFPEDLNLSTALNRPILLNAGLALELILKACLVKLGRFDDFSHDLLSLAEKVPMPYNSDQIGTLQIFSDSVYWYGKYPTPKEEKFLVKNKTNWKNLLEIEKIGTMTITSSNEGKWPTYHNYVKLWDSAHQKYWDIEVPST